MQSDTTLISSLPNNSSNKNSIPFQNNNQEIIQEINQEINQQKNQQNNEQNNQPKNIQNYGELLNSEKNNSLPINHSEYSSQLNSVINSLDKNITDLPSRDIPSNTINIQNDNVIKQNEIPFSNNDYIGNIIDREKILNSEKKQNVNDN